MKKFILTLSLILPTSALAEISYQDILKNPDDSALNQQYALERLQQGEPKTALAAIERVLVKEPANLPARLLRARILFAMGSDLQARGELEALSALPLPDNVSSEVARLLEQLDQRQSRWQSFASFSFGYMEGDNVNSFPDSGQAEINGGVSNFISSNGAREFEDPVDDEALTANIGLYTEYDLLNQNGDKVFANLSFSEIFESDTQFMEYSSYGFSFGAKINRFGIEFSPSISYAEIESETQPNTNFEAINLGLRKVLGPNKQLYANLSLNQRDYEQNAAFPVADNSDVETVSVTAGYMFALTPAWQLNLSANWQDVEADLATAQYNSKEVIYIGAGLRGMIAQGHMLSLNVRIGESEHGAADSGARRIREDDITIYGINYQLFGNAISEKLNNFRLVLGYYNTETESNILQFNNDKTTKSIAVNYIKPF